MGAMARKGGATEAEREAGREAMRLKRERDRSEERDGLGDAARMRRVYEQDKWKDCNGAQRRLRDMLDADPRGYFKLMLELEERDLERLELAEERRREAAREGEKDAGEERVLGLIEELLREASGRVSGGGQAGSGGGGSG